MWVKGCEVAKPSVLEESSRISVTSPVYSEIRGGREEKIEQEALDCGLAEFDSDLLQRCVRTPPAQRVLLLHSPLPTWPQ